MATTTSKYTINQLLRRLEVEVTAENIARVGDVLGKKASKTVRVPDSKVDEVKAAFATPPAPATPEPAAQNGDGGSQSGADSPPSGGAVIRTGSGRASKGHYGRFKSDDQLPHRLRGNDKAILDLLKQIIDSVHEGEKRRREIINKGKMVMVPDVLRPDRYIAVPAKDYPVLKAGNRLPALHEKTKKEIAEPLSMLSLVRRRCTICDDELRAPYYVGMIERVLSGSLKLPYYPRNNDVIKFPRHCEFCKVWGNVEAEVEVELDHVEEGPTKEGMRWAKYVEKFSENEGELLVALMQSDTRQPLSAQEAMGKLRANHEHNQARIREAAATAN